MHNPILERHPLEYINSPALICERLHIFHEQDFETNLTNALPSRVQHCSTYNQDGVMVHVHVHLHVPAHVHVTCTCTFKLIEIYLLLST